MVLGDFIVCGRRNVLGVLEGALMETHDWSRHPLLRELGGLGREVETFLGLVAAEIRTLVLLRFLAQIFALDEGIVDLCRAGSRLDLCNERAHVLVTYRRCRLSLDLSFICVEGAFWKSVGDAEDVFFIYW